MDFDIKCALFTKTFRTWSLSHFTIFLICIITINPHESREYSYVDCLCNLISYIWGLNPWVFRFFFCSLWNKSLFYWNISIADVILMLTINYSQNIAKIDKSHQFLAFDPHVISKKIPFSQSLCSSLIYNFITILFLSKATKVWQQHHDVEFSSDNKMTTSPVSISVASPAQLKRWRYS